MGGVTPDRSREVPIPERSGTAFRKGPGLARPKRSVPFRLQNLGCPGLRARGSLEPTPRALSGLLAPGAGASQHAGRAATPATVFRRLLLCFCFSRRSPVTRCRCCQGCPPVLLRVLVGSVAAVRVAQTKATGGPTPAQRGGAGTGGAETGPADSWDPWAGRAAKRSGVAPRPGNEVFALLGRTGTGQCLVVVTGTAFLVSLASHSPTNHRQCRSNLAGTGLGAPGGRRHRRLLAQPCPSKERSPVA